MYALFPSPAQVAEHRLLCWDRGARQQPELFAGQTTLDQGVKEFVPRLVGMLTPEERVQARNLPPDNLMNLLEKKRDELILDVMKDANRMNELLTTYRETYSGAQHMMSQSMVGVMKFGNAAQAAAGRAERLGKLYGDAGAMAVANGFSDAAGQYGQTATGVMRAAAGLSEKLEISAALARLYERLPIDLAEALRLIQTDRPQAQINGGPLVLALQQRGASPEVQHAVADLSPQVQGAVAEALMGMGEAGKEAMKDLEDVRVRLPGVLDHPRLAVFFFDRLRNGGGAPATGVEPADVNRIDAYIGKLTREAKTRLTAVAQRMEAAARTLPNTPTRSPEAIRASIGKLKEYWAKSKAEKESQEAEFLMAKGMLMCDGVDVDVLEKAQYNLTNCKPPNEVPSLKDPRALLWAKFGGLILIGMGLCKKLGSDWQKYFSIKKTAEQQPQEKTAEQLRQELAHSQAERKKVSDKTTVELKKDWDEAQKTATEAPANKKAEAETKAQQCKQRYEAAVKLDQEIKELTETLKQREQEEAEKVNHTEAQRQVWETIKGIIPMKADATMGNIVSTVPEPSKNPPVKAIVTIYWDKVKEKAESSPTTLQKIAGFAAVIASPVPMVSSVISAVKPPSPADRVTAYLEKRKKAGNFIGDNNVETTTVNRSELAELIERLKTQL